MGGDVSALGPQSGHIVVVANWLTPLDEITASARATNQAIDRITSSVEQMSRASTGVLAGMDEIGRIAVATDAAASSMTAHSETVGQSVDSIAAVSEENSAAAEEVSAATQELSAHSETVATSADELSRTADQLDELVSRFRLADATSERETDRSNAGAQVVSLRHDGDPWAGAAPSYRAPLPSLDGAGTLL